MYINNFQLYVQCGSLRENNFGGVRGDSVAISFRREIEIQRCERKLVIYSSGSAVTALKLSVEIARRYIVDRLMCSTLGPIARFPRGRNLGSSTSRRIT